MVDLIVIALTAEGISAAFHATVIADHYPALAEAMAAIISQADEIITKPFQIGSIKELIRTRLANPLPVKRVSAESAATILERDTDITIQNWLELVAFDFSPA